MNKLLASEITLLLFAPISLGQSDSLTPKSSEPTPVQFLLKNISGGDFDFQFDWSYPENVFVNQWEQLSCDWICPPELDRMKDAQGKIYEDSLNSYYQILDTTHLPHTIKCEASMYEFTGTHFIDFKETEDGIIGTTTANASTHSVLTIQIVNGVCYAWVDLNSIRDLGEHRFELKVGRMMLDKASYQQGIIKGSFDFRFVNHLDADIPLFWRGTIVSTFEKG